MFFVDYIIQNSSHSNYRLYVPI